jgi:hypothetical protein
VCVSRSKRTRDSCRDGKPMRVVVGLAVFLGVVGCTPGRQQQADPPETPSDATVSRLAGQVSGEHTNAPYPGDGRACADGDVTFTLGRQGAWHGDVMQGVLARNISATACTFNPPAISVTDKSGKVMDVKPDDGVASVTLEPDELAYIDVAGQSPPCGDVPRPSSLTHGFQLAVALPLSAA